jgi:hypothetical protein
MAEDIPLDSGAGDIPLDVALSSVLAAAIDHGDRQALLMALHRSSAEVEPSAGTTAGETATAPEATGTTTRLVPVPAPRPETEPAPNGEADGGGVVLAFTPRREWEPEDPPPAA